MIVFAGAFVVCSAIVLHVRMKRKLQEEHDHDLKEMREQMFHEVLREREKLESEREELQRERMKLDGEYEKLRFEREELWNEYERSRIEPYGALPVQAARAVIAVTRSDYVTMVDGRIQHFEPDDTNYRYHRLDVSPLENCRDLVDIKGGFDFVIGLRANGEVVAAKTHDEPRPGMNNFLQVEGWSSVVSISAAEGRVAALTRDGKILQSTDGDFSQAIVTPPQGKFRSVAAGYNSLWTVDQYGDVAALPMSAYYKTMVDGYRLAREQYGVEFAQIVCDEYYYAPTTTAALTTDGQVFWIFDMGGEGAGSRPARKVPLQGVEKIAVTRAAVAMITRDESAYLVLWDHPDHVIPVGMDIAAIELMFDGKIVMIDKNGICRYEDFPEIAAR